MLPSRSPIESLTPYIVPDEVIPPHRGAVATWTGITRGEDFILARTFRGVAFMGGLTIDLRHARVGQGVSTIELRCFWGGIVIIVPNDLHLEVDVDAFAGGTEVKRQAPSIALPGAPTIRLTGTVIMGGVEVKVVTRDAIIDG